MGDSKALPILGGVMLVLFLPLLIVLALIAGGLAGMDTASADCVPTQSEGKAFAWPTDRHEVDQGWSAVVGRGQSPHRGIDFDVDEGSKVYAAEDGEVVSASGDEVRIRHDQGVETRYKYFKDITVKAGAKVKRGQQIGTSGSGSEGTPGLSGDHLHFELWVDQKNDGTLVNTDPKNDSFGDDAGSDDSGGGCGCSTLVGSNNQQKAFNYFASNGYSKEQAAGIVGNMIHESGVEPGRLQNTPPGKVTNPSDAVESSLGWGIVQWTPAGKMIKPSRQAGVDDANIVSLDYQLDFLKKQLAGQGPIPEKNAGDMVKAAKSAEDAAVAFGRYYERFAGSDNLSNPRYTQRKTAAAEVLSTFGGTAPSGSGGCGAGNGDIVKTDGLRCVRRHGDEDERCGQGLRPSRDAHAAGVRPKFPEVPGVRELHERGTAETRGHLREQRAHVYLHRPLQGWRREDVQRGVRLAEHRHFPRAYAGGGLRVLQRPARALHRGPDQEVRESRTDGREPAAVRAQWHGCRHRADPARRVSRVPRQPGAQADDHVGPERPHPEP